MHTCLLGFNLLSSACEVQVVERGLRRRGVDPVGDGPEEHLPSALRCNCRAHHLPIDYPWTLASVETAPCPVFEGRLTFRVVMSRVERHTVQLLDRGVEIRLHVVYALIDEAEPEFPVGEQIVQKPMRSRVPVVQCCMRWRCV